MKYIVYLTTNLVNNKIYIGVHETENPEIFDGYLGCGLNRKNYNTYMKHPKTPIHFAIKKYGYDSFKRQTIKIFDDIESALKLEAEIVTEDFIKRPDVYNATIGGGLPPNLSKVVYQYDLQGNYLNTWPSMTEVGGIYNISPSCIGLAIMYKRACVNYFWTFEKYNNLNISEYSVFNPEVQVHLYNSDGKYLRSYESYTKCQLDLGVSSVSHIQRAIKLGNKVLNYFVSLTKSNIFQKPNLPRLQGQVHQYDLNGNYILSFKSVKEAETKLNLGKLSGINTSIKMKELYKGYLWSRGEKLDSLPPYKIPKSHAKKIALYTMNGEFVKEYNTISEAKKQFPNVGKVLRGQAKHCHNFIFKYVE